MILFKSIFLAVFSYWPKVDQIQKINVLLGFFN